jgi:predicted esterase
MMQSLAVTIVPGEPPAADERREPGRLVTVERDGCRAYVLPPPALEPGRRLPLVLVLHGAGRQDELLVRAYAGEPERRNALFVVLRSFHPTWDLIAGGKGEDLAFLGWALGWIEARWPVDSTRRALLGYSDGASYGLSVGLSNPKLFAAIMCWAAGFIAVDTANLQPDDPKPRILLEHGTQDQLFPFERVAMPMREALTRAGFDVTFRVDEGGIHWPSPGFQPAALDWFLGPASGGGPAQGAGSVG